MADVDEIIDYIKSLKKGFDKDLFQSKIDELAYAVDTTGIEYNDFHTLFKVWLNLSIPITKWVSLGACLVPQDSVNDQTVEYALSWILSNLADKPFSRIGFLMDWLTAAMESQSIDMESLATGYCVFYACLKYEVLTPHAIKLVYTLARPVDVTRKRVLELLNYAEKREGKKKLSRQLQVLLGLFKSYKPECVPEDVPVILIHTAFKKINTNLLDRFKRKQDHGRNKKADPLVPNTEFFGIGSKQYADKESQESFLDFTDLVHSASRPSQLRGLLCNATGAVLLAVASHADQAFFSYDLHHLLNSCFLEKSPHSYIEKQDLLYRLAILQHTLMQGVPVITRFLAQYLRLWNENDFFAEILELVKWVSVDSPDHVMYVVEPLTRIYHRAQPIEQCAILKSLNNMYSNLIYASTRPRLHFMGISPSPLSYSLLLPKVATAISDMCNKQLQVTPDHVAMAVDSPVKRDGGAEPRAVEPSSHRQNLIALRDQLVSVLDGKLKCRLECLTDELSDPAAQPLVWVGRWVDNSKKYGFGYQLCDESVGVMFIDSTKLIMLANGLNVHYINGQGQEQYMTMREYPQELDNKMKLLTFFRIYMTEHLMKAGASVPVRESDGLSRLPHLHQWFITTLAVIMCLTNGTLQINFQDHTKIILCPLMQAVTYIDMDKNFRTFRFSTIEEHGCDKKLFSNLTYALEKLNSVLASEFTELC